MRERLLAEVRARTERFAAAKDPAIVLDPATLAEVAALLEAASGPTADLEAAEAAGRLHWCRYLVLDPGDNQQDLSTALRLLEPVHRAQLAGVPDQVRAHFDAGRPAAPGDPGVMAVRAVDLLRHTLRTGGRVELDGAIDLLRQALDASPSGHADRAAMLSNLSLASRIRFERTGDQADLDEAFEVSWDALAATPADHPVGCPNCAHDLRPAPS